MARKKSKTSVRAESEVRQLQHLQDVEKRTGRTLSVRTKAHLASLRIKVKKQRTSRFFTLPAEIRVRIYECVFAEYHDPNELYKTTARYFRPGYEGRLKTDTTMLLTCRRVWIEANHLPLKLATHAFWFFNGPLDLARLKQGAAADMDIENGDETKRVPSEINRYQSFFQRMTPLNRLQLNRIHIFASQPWLQNFGLDPTTLFQVDWFNANHVTITIRDSEWGAWKDMGESDVDRSWLETLLRSPNLRDIQTLHLEFEMNVNEEEKLEAIISRFSNLRGRYFKRRGDVVNGQWERLSFSSPKQDNLGGGSTCRTFYTTRVITWVSTRSHEGLHKHPRGYWICDGELEDFRSERQKFMAETRKRGGRRSKSVWYRNHWQPRYLSEKEIEKQDEAAAHVEYWIQEGSLLRLI